MIYATFKKGDEIRTLVSENVDAIVRVIYNYCCENGWALVNVEITEDESNEQV